MIPGSFAIPITFIWGIFIAKANRKLIVLNIVTIISQFLIYSSSLVLGFIFKEPVSIFDSVYIVLSLIAIAFTLILIDVIIYFVKRCTNPHW